MIFHSWYDRLQEPYRFFMMFVIMSPSMVAIYYNRPVLFLSYLLLILTTRWYYLTRKTK